MTSFKATNSVFIRTDLNNSFSNYTPSHWTSEDGDGIVDKVKELLEFRSQNDNELLVKEVGKKVTREKEKTMAAF